MTFQQWAMFQCIAAFHHEEKCDMKTVWLLVKGQTPVFFFTGHDWTKNESTAHEYATREEAAEVAYNMQAHYQNTIVPEPVYRKSSSAISTKCG